VSAKISIIIATSNSESTLEDTLACINAQTYSNIESVVIDNDSTDSTRDMVIKFLSPGDIFISEKDAGIYSAFNKGISESSGDIIGFLNSDDMFYSSEIITKINELFLKNPDVNVVYGNLQYCARDDVNSINRTWISSKFKKTSLRYGWMPPHPTLFVRKEIYDLIGKYNTNYNISADYDFILRLFSNNKVKSLYYPEFIIKMRVGGISTRPREFYKKLSEDYTIAVRHDLNPFILIFFKIVRKTTQFFYV
jgi:glycosyltransferase